MPSSLDFLMALVTLMFAWKKDDLRDRLNEVTPLAASRQMALEG